MEDQIQETLHDRQNQLRMKLEKADDSAEKMALMLQMFALEERLSRIQ